MAAPGAGGAPPRLGQDWAAERAGPGAAVAASEEREGRKKVEGREGKAVKIRGPP